MESIKVVFVVERLLTLLVGLNFLPFIVWMSIDASLSTNPPTFKLRYVITENQPESFRIGQLNEDLIQAPDVEQSPIYDLLTKRPDLMTYRASEPSDLIQLDPQTGQLTTKRSIDVEQLCPRHCSSSGQALITQSVELLWRGQVVARCLIELTVIDVDDNRPEFPLTLERPYTLRLKEVIYRIGRQIELPRASDRDVHKDHARIRYRLEAHPEDTQALSTFKLVDDQRLALVLQRDLDYEQFRLYRFYLVALPVSPSSPLSPFESSFRQLPSSETTKLEIRVEVLDINDMEPKFDQALYTIDVNEDAPINSSIFKLSATDGDANSTLSYSMEASSDQSVDGAFRVESDGSIFVNRRLDFENWPGGELSIRASDGEFFASTRLKIIIHDVNDEPPDYVSEPKQLWVMENQPKGTLIGQVLIIDRDSPEINGQIECEEPFELVDNQPIEFKFDSSRSSNNGDGHSLRITLRSRRAFDREKDAIHQLARLTCRDGIGVKDQPSLTSTLTFSVLVGDQNDNSPDFESTQYSAELEENCPLGTKVVQVKATDGDSESWARPRYLLQKGDRMVQPFEVDSKTGWITTSADIDRETASVHQLMILAVDGWRDEIDGDDNVSQIQRAARSNEKHTATTYVHVTVVDVNDNAPEFRGPRQFAVEEHRPDSTWIGDLQVLDRDVGKNRDVEFERVADVNNQPENHIMVTKNGSLFTTAELDREVKDRYCFEVVARDLGEASRMSTTDTICVRVLDINDNNPIFRRIKGSDLDANSSSQDSVENAAKVETVNGSIQNQRPNSPSIVRVSVNEEPGYCALIAEADDADDGRNNELRFDLKRHDMSDVEGEPPITPDQLPMPFNAFIMDKQSGRLMLTRHLTSDDIGSYVITLISSDQGSKTRNAEQTVQLLIEDKPAKGNWLFPTLAENVADNTSSSYLLNSGSMTEKHTVLIVIILSSVSALMAAILICAILCMLKPCKRRRRRTSCLNGGDASLKHASSPSLVTAPTPFDYPTATGGLLMPPPPMTSTPCSFNDFTSLPPSELMISPVSDNTSELTSFDSRQRSLIITSRPTVTGFEHLFLSPDKVIGVDSTSNCYTTEGCVDDLNELQAWAPSTLSMDRYQQMNGTLQMSVASPHGNDVCGGQAGSTSWVPIPQQVWTPLVHESLAPSQDPTFIHIGHSSLITSPSTSNQLPGEFQPQYHLMSPGDVPLWSPSHPPPSNHQVSSGWITSTTPAPPHLVDFSALPGEEQRSDSGRGASDEEIVGVTSKPILHRTTISGTRVSTLRTLDASSYLVGDNTATAQLRFPSLPRIVNNHQSPDHHHQTTPHVVTFLRHNHQLSSPETEMTNTIVCEQQNPTSII